jgi:NADH-quinone oxidoreductase subunit C
MDFREILIRKVQEKFSGESLTFSDYKNECVLQTDKKNIAAICNFLKNDPELLFELCEDITTIDWAKRKNRFTVVYHIYSLKNNFRLRIKTDLDESDCSVDSVTSVWKSANWYERESWDMYGIKFNNHPDLRRIYLPEDFEYHPLRKDFPLMGIPGSLSLPKK